MHLIYPVVQRHFVERNSFSLYNPINREGNLIYDISMNVHFEK